MDNAKTWRRLRRRLKTTGFLITLPDGISKQPTTSRGRQSARHLYRRTVFHKANRWGFCGASFFVVESRLALPTVRSDGRAKLVVRRTFTLLLSASGERM